SSPITQTPFVTVLTGVPPEHAPAQLPNGAAPGVEAEAAVNVNVTSLRNSALHVAPHAIPGGRLVTGPATNGGTICLLTSSRYRCLKVALTSGEAVVTWQAPVPLHAPLQPANAKPEPADAVSVKAPVVAEHNVGQRSLRSEELTVPPRDA